MSKLLVKLNNEKFAIFEQTSGNEAGAGEDYQPGKNYILRNLIEDDRDFLSKTHPKIIFDKNIHLNHAQNSNVINLIEHLEYIEIQTTIKGGSKKDNINRGDINVRELFQDNEWECNASEEKKYLKDLIVSDIPEEDFVSFLSSENEICIFYIHDKKLSMIQIFIDDEYAIEILNDIKVIFYDKSKSSLEVYYDSYYESEDFINLTCQRPRRENGIYKKILTTKKINFVIKLAEKLGNNIITKKSTFDVKEDKIIEDKENDINELLKKVPQKFKLVKLPIKKTIPDLFPDENLKLSKAKLTKTKLLTNPEPEEEEEEENKEYRLNPATLKKLLDQEKLKGGMNLEFKKRLEKMENYIKVLIQ